MKKSEFFYLFWFVALGLLVGFLTGFTPWGMFIGALAYSVWSISRMRSAAQWLRSDFLGQPPESQGEWGELLDALYRLWREKQNDRKALEDRVTHFQNSFASLSDAVVLLDSDRTISWCNEAANLLLGISTDDIANMITNLVRDPAFVSYFDSEDYKVPLSMKAPTNSTNSESELEVHITFFGSGNRLLFFRDVTELRHLERMRTDFIANVSHELRTPMTVISGYLETMLDSDSEWQAVLQQMQSQSVRMESLLTDLIQLTKLESAPEHASQAAIDIRALVNIVFDEVSLQKPRQNMKYVSRSSARVLGNHEDLHSMLSNLVGNASKYSDDDGSITVTWASDEQGGKLCIADNGIGIEARHINRLTERFYRVDSSRHRETGGTGLGLAIVKHILLRHDAELEIHSEPNEGSEFCCRFPEERLVADNAR